MSTLAAKGGMRKERLDADLLGPLSELLDHELEVLCFHPGGVFQTGFRAPLARVSMGWPESSAITLDFEGPNSLILPQDVTAYRGPLCHGAEECWIEFQLDFGGVVWIEQVPTWSSV